MTPNHIDDFGRLMKDIGELYKFRPTKAIMNLYWTTLDPYQIEDVISATYKHVMSPKYGNYMPKPCDIIRQISGDCRTVSHRDWLNFYNSLSQVGPYDLVKYESDMIHGFISYYGGWKKIRAAIHFENNKTSFPTSVNKKFDDFYFSSQEHDAYDSVAIGPEQSAPCKYAQIIHVLNNGKIEKLSIGQKSMYYN